MNRYCLIAIVGLAAGCKTMDHHGSEAHHPNEQARPVPMEHGQPMRPMMQERRARMGPMITPGRSIGEEHFGNVVRALNDARKNGYVSNDEYADLFEKLMADSRWIIVEEIKAMRPPGPMPPQPRSLMPQRPRREKKDE